jgi:ATP-dependent Lhr-like helicase
MLFIGPESERRFGRRHFIELTASFTAPPQFTVLSGRTEIGRMDPSVLTEERPGPRRLLLAGRSWQVTFIDWGRKRVSSSRSRAAGSPSGPVAHSSASRTH